MFVVKIPHKFNEYVDEDKNIVKSISKAKKFNSKKEAEQFLQASPVFKNPTEILEMRKI